MPTGAGGRSQRDDRRVARPRRHSGSARSSPAARASPRPRWPHRSSAAGCSWRSPRAPAPRRSSAPELQARIAGERRALRSWRMQAPGGASSIRTQQSAAIISAPSPVCPVQARARAATSRNVVPCGEVSKARCSPPWARSQLAGDGEPEAGAVGLARAGERLEQALADLGAARRARCRRRPPAPPRLVELGPQRGSRRRPGPGPGAHCGRGSAARGRAGRDRPSARARPAPRCAGACRGAAWPPSTRRPASRAEPLRLRRAGLAMRAKLRVSGAQPCRPFHGLDQPRRHACAPRGRRWRRAAPTAARRGQDVLQIVVDARRRRRRAPPAGSSAPAPGGCAAHLGSSRSTTPISSPRGDGGGSAAGVLRPLAEVLQRLGDAGPAASRSSAAG